MLEKLGKRRYAAPVMAIIVVFCILALVMYPTLNAAPKNVPFALLNLDEGAKLPTGSVTLGDEITKKMLEGVELQEGVEMPLAWTELESEAALDEAFENNEFYGAIIIPKDFTTAQMAAAASAGAAGVDPAAAAAAAAGVDPAAAAAAAAAAGVDPAAAAAAAGVDPAAAAAAAAGVDPAAAAAAAGTDPAAAIAAQNAAAAQNTTAAAPSPPTIRVIINQGKNVMLATTMQTALTSMLGQSGLNIEVTLINAVDTGGGGMAAMMSGMIMVMPTFILSLICSALLYLLFRPAKGESRGTRVKAYGKQLAYAVAASALVACSAVLLVTWVGGMEIPVAAAFLFLWLASFCLMAVFIGALDVALPLGALVIACCFALGMGTAMLAYEMLPIFWQDWVYPWAPQRYISGGVSSIIYFGKEAWNDSSLPLVVTGCIGLVLMALAALLPTKKQSTA